MSGALPSQPSLAETTHTSLSLPDGCDQNTWEVVGYSLVDRTHSLSFWLGDWWNAGHQFGHRKKFVESDAWTGPAYGTCRDIAWVCNRFLPEDRFEDLPFSFHREVAGIASHEVRQDLLAKASEEGWTQAILRAQVKALKDLTQDVSQLVGMGGVQKVPQISTGHVPKVQKHHDEEQMAQVWTITVPDHWSADHPGDVLDVMLSINAIETIFKK